MKSGQGAVPALVERDEELAHLDALIAAARSGAGGTMLIEGAAGIGKTSLLASARARAASGGMQVLHARGTQLERDFPMGLVRQTLEPAVRQASDPEELFGGAAALARSVLFDLPDAPNAAPVGVLHGLYWLTANLAERAPLLLVIDDAHWADEPSLRFVAYLARRVESLSAALVIATRASEATGGVAQTLDEIRNDTGGQLLQPRPLAVAGVAEVLREFTDGVIEEQFARACREATGGNPFLLSELVRTLRVEDVPFTAVSASRLGGFAPPTVARRVRATLDRLGPAARALARAVAVLGDDVELNLAAELAEIPITEASGVAAELARAGVLADTTPLRFLHPLLAGATQADLTMAERGDAHRAAAELLRVRGAEPERVALQLMHAAPAADEQVVHELRLAAERAQRRGAPATAVDLLHRALAEPPPSDARAALLLELGQAEYAVGRTDEAALHLEEAHRCANESVIRGLALVGLFQARGGDFAEQRAMASVFETTVPGVLKQDRELGLRLWTLQLLAIEPGPAWDEAVRGVQGLKCETPGEAVLLGHAALPITNRGTTAAELAAVAEQAARHVDALFEEGATALAMTGIVLGLLWTDRLGVAEGVLERAINVARRRGATGDFALAHQFRAWVNRRAGQLHDAEADARTALAASSGTGWAGAGLGAIIPLVGSLVDQGRVEEAAAELTAMHPQEEVADAPAMTGLLSERMRLRAAQGRQREALADWEEARRRAERHFGGINASWIPDLLSAAGCHHVLGEFGARDALLSEALALAEHWGTPGFLGQVKHRTARLANDEDAIEVLAEAVALLRRSPARLELARALVSLGEILRRRGQRAASREPLREGYELARQCGAGALSETARAELRASGIRIRREALTGADSLTASERRIAELAAAGASNAEIAQALFLTVKTVESHLTHSYRKLDIAGRSELAEALTAKS